MSVNINPQLMSLKPTWVELWHRTPTNINCCWKNKNCSPRPLTTAIDRQTPCLSLHQSIFRGISRQAGSWLYQLIISLILATHLLTFYIPLTLSLPPNECHKFTDPLISPHKMSQRTTKGSGLITSVLDLLLGGPDQILNNSSPINKIPIYLSIFHS